MPLRLPSFLRNFHPRQFTAPLLASRQIHCSPAPRQGYASSSPSRLRNVGMKTPKVRPSDKYMADLIVERHAEKKRAVEKTDKTAVIREEAIQLQRRMHRRWEAGEVYSPHDLSPVEMWKMRRKGEPNVDVVDALGLRPLDMYKNFSLIRDFTTSSGQIQPSSVTGLRPVNQRKIAKMIRRVQGMGIYPTIHDHPELLRSRFYPSGDKNVWEPEANNR
ncbi:hypothetical protein CP533_3357 [Ophiocordyceps camponoti-saundersi (nom. inval.)]|nr:hypothetical protein CP533_3357 [Ophiocordyceps camponoti-saundersi (nom. inval.)]